MWHREPVVAGSFYPANPDELETMIDTYLREAGNAKLSRDVVGVISPHAGYIYSGPVAAYSFANLENDIEVAVVLAPSHRARFDGASVIPEGMYKTPLGDVEIDSDIGGELVKKKNYSFVKEAHQYEHSLEVQVPFLQKVLGDFTIVPIIVGTTELSVCSTLADALSEVLTGEKRKYGIIVSTDLSHYHSYNVAVDIDGNLIDRLKRFDENSVYDVCKTRKAEACGEGPVLAGMIASKKLGATGLEVIKYANSGDTAGPRSQVVGYLSAAFVK